jgi:ribosomal protein S18 acetylase RimI-like enzyme
MVAKIASMRPEDEADFLALAQAFYEHEHFVFDAAASSRMIRHLLANPQSGSVYLAWQGGQAVGYVVLTHGYSLEFGGPFVLLDEIFVLPGVQGTGLGKRLIDVAAAYCLENGFGYLRLEVQKKNARAVSVYQTYGFRTEDRYLMSLQIQSGAEADADHVDGR